MQELKNVFTCYNELCPQRHTCWHFSEVGRSGIPHLKMNPDRCKAYDLVGMNAFKPGRSLWVR